MKNLSKYINEKLKGSTLKTYENDEYVDLGLPSGTLWGKYNVGATHKSTPESWYGNYFMWGDTEPADNKTCNYANYKYFVVDDFNVNIKGITKYCTNKYYWEGKGKCDNKLELDNEDDIVNVNIGGNWYMPTKESFEELIKNTTHKWVKNYNNIKGLKGILFTSKNNDNDLFFPASGGRSVKYISNKGEMVFLWTSTISSGNPIYAYTLFSEDDDVKLVSIYERCHGFSVRGVFK